MRLYKWCVLFLLPCLALAFVDKCTTRTNRNPWQVPNWGRTQNRPCLNVTFLVREIPRVLRKIFLATSTHFDLSNTETPACVVKWWWEQILPSYAAKAQKERIAGLHVPPMQVPAWVVYMGVHCEKTLAKWFLGLYNCSHIETKLTHWVEEGLFEYSRSAFYLINDFDVHYQMASSLQISQILDTSFGRETSPVLLVEDASLSQTFVDSAIEAGIKHLLVSMNPNTNYPANPELYPPRGGFRWPHSQHPESTIHAIFHPLAYGSLTCHLTPTDSVDTQCNTPAYLDQLQLTGVITGHHDAEPVGLVNIVLNENSEGLLSAVELVYPPDKVNKSWPMFLAFLKDQLIKDGWATKETELVPAGLGDFFRPLTTDHLPLHSPSWLLGQQWLPEMFSDPLVPQIYRAATRTLGDDRSPEIIPYRAALLAMVEHNYATIPGNWGGVQDKFPAAVSQKRNWVLALQSNQKLWGAVEQALRGTIAEPPVTPGIRNTSCGNVRFDVSRDGYLMGITFAEGSRFQDWKGWHNASLRVPLFHIAYGNDVNSGLSSTLDAVRYGYADTEDNSQRCTFVIQQNFSSFTTGTNKIKYVNVSTAMSYGAQFSEELDILVTVQASAADLTRPDVTAGDALLAHFSLEGDHAWKIRGARPGTTYPLTELSSCAGRNLPVPFPWDAKQEPAVTRGPFTVESAGSFACTSVNRLSTKIKDNILSVLPTWNYTDKIDYYSARPNYRLGLGFVLWDNFDPDWNTWAPVETDGYFGKWGSSLQFPFRLLREQNRMRRVTGNPPELKQKVLGFQFSNGTVTLSLWDPWNGGSLQPFGGAANLGGLVDLMEVCFIWVMPNGSLVLLGKAFETLTAIVLQYADTASVTRPPASAFLIPDLNGRVVYAWDYPRADGSFLVLGGESSGAAAACRCWPGNRTWSCMQLDQYMDPAGGGAIDILSHPDLPNAFIVIDQPVKNLRVQVFDLPSSTRLSLSMSKAALPCDVQKGTSFSVFDGQIYSVLGGPRYKDGVRVIGVLSFPVAALQQPEFYVPDPLWVADIRQAYILSYNPKSSWVDPTTKTLVALMARYNPPPDETNYYASAVISFNGSLVSWQSVPYDPKANDWWVLYGATYIP
eukprot:TRINITY_DN16909_c0_g1_i1.p1 TRINITY_DN16909_c0_g1~~TRINITY_DN16909_c0_g1_i1.p1  ORF type:complete len:1111 (+),score=114.40 TRINITY_DN16909_c0_g1_i1:89-3421(+)